ncbi:RimK family alpha-L-glutamate ligase [Streptacidiphilus sp. MAP5-3]|uniref:ATP-grasp domain-containing protein n=1 Tax=unclassified Streptacidiphilus TaxID=2643834 RepID=UPI00351901AD
MPDIALLTGRTMPRDVPENDLLVDELRQLGIRAEVHPWDEPLDWPSFGLALVRTTWDYWDRLEEFLSFADHADGRTALRNPAQVIRWNCHKGYLVELAGHGVPSIPTQVLRRGADGRAVDAALAAFREQHGEVEVVAKPAVSAGARGALRALPSAPGTAAHLADLLERGDALLQPLVESILTRGETSLIFFGEEYSHAVRKVPAQGEYRIHEHHGGTVQAHSPSDAELATARAALAAAPAATAYGRVDLVELPSGPAVMELELIEPELFLPYADGATTRYARHLAALLP